MASFGLGTLITVSAPPVKIARDALPDDTVGTHVPQLKGKVRLRREKKYKVKRTYCLGFQDTFEPLQALQRERKVGGTDWMYGLRPRKLLSSCRGDLWTQTNNGLPPLGRSRRSDYRRRGRGVLDDLHLAIVHRQVSKLGLFYSLRGMSVSRRGQNDWRGLWRPAAR